MRTISFFNLNLSYRSNAIKAPAINSYLIENGNAGLDGYAELAGFAISAAANFISLIPRSDRQTGSFYDFKNSFLF